MTESTVSLLIRWTKQLEILLIRMVNVEAQRSQSTNDSANGEEEKTSFKLTFEQN